MRKNILKRLIDNLSGADLRRVRKDPMEIMGLEHPSEAAQLYVVRQNPEMIQFIGAPSEKVQLEVVRKDASLIMLLDAPPRRYSWKRSGRTQECSCISTNRRRR